MKLRLHGTRLAQTLVLFSYDFILSCVCRKSVVSPVKMHLYSQASHMLQGTSYDSHPDSKVLGTNMGPIWGRQDPGGPHVGPMNLNIQASWL